MSDETESRSDAPQDNAPKKAPYVPRGFKYVGPGLPPPGMLDRDYSYEELKVHLPKWSDRKKLAEREPQAFEFDPPYDTAVDEDED